MRYLSFKQKNAFLLALLGSTLLLLINAAESASANDAAKSTDEKTSGNCKISNGKSLISLPMLFDDVIFELPIEDSIRRFAQFGPASGSYAQPPTDPYVTLNRAFILVLCRHYDEAIAEYEKVPQLLGEGYGDWKFFQKRACGFAYEKAGKFDDALRQYKLVGQYAGRARLLVKLGRFNEAKTIADSELKNTNNHGHSDFHPLYQIRAAAEAGLGNDQAAVDDLIEAIKDPVFSDPNECIKNANLLIARSKLPMSQLPLQKIEREEGKTKEIDSAELRRVLSNGEIETLSPPLRAALEKNVTEYSEKIIQHTEVPDLFRDRARALSLLDKFPEALADADHAIQLGGRPYLRERAAIYERMKNYKAAIKDVIESINNRKPGPEMKDQWLKLASLYSKNKQNEEGIDACNNALVDCRETANAYFQRAKCEAALGQVQKARLDATTAMTECFDHIRIPLRDQIKNWLADLPVEQAKQ